ncbi:MAG: hypothetical protein ACOX0Y_11920 [Thiopseudomonas sp.]|jgi:hypothetical protein
MQFYISEQKVRKDRRWTIVLLAVLLLSSLAMLVKAVQAEAASDLLLPIAALFIFALGIFASYRHIQQGKAAYPVVTLDEQNHQAVVNYNNAVVHVNLLQVKALRFQTRFGRVKSIILKADTGQIFKLVGFENMDALIATLERLVPAEKVSRSAFLHQ